MKKALKKLSILTIALMVMFAMTVPTYAAAKINKTKATMCTGKTLQLKVTGTKSKVKWSSNKKAVATVSNAGKVTAKKKGTATITAKVGKKKYTCKITVESPKLSKTSISITKGKSYTLKLNNTKSKVTWSSSKKAVATVNAKGKVSAKKAGTAVITAKVNGKKFNCRVTVKAASSSSSGKVTVTSVSTNKGIVAFVKNGYSYTVEVNLQCMYYKNGSAVKTSSDSEYALEPGRTIVMQLYNYSTDWTSYKLITKHAKASSNIIRNASKIKVTASRGENNNVVAEVKNAGKYCTSTQLGCVFYKGGKAVGCSITYADVDKAGSSDFVTFYGPYDSNYNKISYDSYKVYVNHSYRYNWQKQS